MTAVHHDPDLWGPEEADWDKEAPSAEANPFPDDSELAEVYDRRAEADREQARQQREAREPTDEPPAIDEGDFWTARRALVHVHAFARARRVAPWAVLGGVLARVVTATGPDVQLPPTIGSYASINLFVGLVGPSGAGKDAAAKVAKDALDLGKTDFLTVPLGSGEGLSHMFMRPGKEEPEQFNTAALVTISEIDTMTALVKRQASTVASQLRQAAMGEQLGFWYVDTTKRMIVPEHRYRLCLLVGIQPARAGALLDDADGGTPQRFVWLPATDPDAPDVPPPCPPPLVWLPPAWHDTGRGGWNGGMYHNPVAVCDTATRTIVAAHLARTRGRGDALDGHALLTRLKIATALAILEGRPEVDDDDWALSGVVMAVSDRTRAAVQKVLSVEQAEHNKRQAEAEASRTIVVQERVEEATVRRVARNLRRHLAAADGWVVHTELRHKLPTRDRLNFEPAMAALLLAGDAQEEKIDYHGKPGRQYRFVGGQP